jgi:hypothetical protein
MVHYGAPLFRNAFVIAWLVQFFLSGGDLSAQAASTVPVQTSQTAAAARRAPLEVGVTVGAPTFLINLGVGHWSGSTNTRISGMYYGPDLYGAEASLTHLVRDHGNSSHSTGLAYALYHSVEDRGPDRNDDRFIGHVVGAVYGYRRGHLFLETGPAVVLNRGPALGGFLQIGYNQILFGRLLSIARSVGSAAGRARRNKMESWYTYWGLGYANVAYSREQKEKISRIADLPGADHSPVALDCLGFYWPAGQQRLYGVVVNAFGDRYAVNSHNWIQVDGDLLAASALHFVNEIGAGPFLRVDLGLARYGWSSESGGGNDTDTSDWGLGGLVGGGYALPVTEGTRLLFNLNYALRRVEGDNTRTLGISLGGLF